MCKAGGEGHEVTRRDHFPGFCGCPKDSSRIWHGCAAASGKCPSRSAGAGLAALQMRRPPDPRLVGRSQGEDAIQNVRRNRQVMSAVGSCESETSLPAGINAVLLHQPLHPQLAYADALRPKLPPDAQHVALPFMQKCLNGFRPAFEGVCQPVVRIFHLRDHSPARIR